MAVTDRLLALMEQRGLNRSELARGSGVPYTTIVALFEKGSDNIKLSTMKKLAAYLEVTLDELADDAIQAGNGDVQDSMNLSDEQIITMAAHRIGHEGELTPQELDQIKLAMKIALAKNQL